MLPSSAISSPLHTTCIRNWASRLSTHPRLLVTITKWRDRDALSAARPTTRAAATIEPGGSISAAPCVMNIIASHSLTLVFDALGSGELSFSLHLYLLHIYIYAIVLERCARGDHDATTHRGAMGIICAVMLFPIGLICLSYVVAFPSFMAWLNI